MSTTENFPLDSEIQQSHALKDEIMEKANTLAEQNNAVVARQENAADETFAIPGDETYSLKADGPRGIAHAVDMVDCSGLTAPWTQVLSTKDGAQLIHNETGERMSIEDTKKMYAEAHEEFKQIGKQIPINDANEDAVLNALADDAVKNNLVPVARNAENGLTSEMINDEPQLLPRSMGKSVSVATIGAGPSMSRHAAAGMAAHIIEKAKEEDQYVPEEKIYGRGETPPQAESNSQRKKRIAAEHNARKQTALSQIEHTYPVLSVRVKEATKEIIVDVLKQSAGEINNGAKLGKYIMCSPGRTWGANRTKLLPRASQGLIGTQLTPAFCDFIVGLFDETVAFEIRHNRLRKENVKSYHFTIDEHIWVKEGFATGQ